MSNKDLAKQFSSKFGGSAKRTKARKRTAGAAAVTRGKPVLMRRGLLLGGAATIVAFAGFAQMVNSNKPVTREPVPRKLRIVLIDSSDRNTAVQDRLITRFVETDTVADLREGDRLILVGLTADPEEPLEERFNRVSPPRAVDKSAWESDPNQLEAAWTSQFLAEYVREARSLRAVLEKKQTPFLEALNQISSILNAYEGEQKEVVLVSDALQHINQGLSAYTSSPNRLILNMPQELAGFYQPDFGGAKVTLLHILRAKDRQRQGQAHRAWIDNIIRDRNAALNYVALS
jgi:hypothetical protein